ncbi:MAG: peptidase C1, partial [Bacteroidia bacterium]|nr:peptidase C1 [Bacteroidia bacterium]
MKKLLAIALMMSFVCIGMAQTKKDKASFKASENDFYRGIKKSLGDYNSEEDKAKTYFKMDFTGMDVPKSADEFTKVWTEEPESQGRTGTCWCFSTTSFYESEIYRNTKQKVALSELYTVYWEYVEKARGYVQTRGESFFGEGSETNA